MKIAKIKQNAFNFIPNLFRGFVVHFNQLNCVVPADVFRPVNGVNPSQRFARQNEILLAKNYALRRFVHISYLTCEKKIKSNSNNKIPGLYFS